MIFWNIYPQSIFEIKINVNKKNILYRSILHKIVKKTYRAISNDYNFFRPQ